VGVDLGAVKSQTRHRSRASLYRGRSNFADCASTRTSPVHGVGVILLGVEVWGRLLSFLRSKSRNGGAESLERR
jgi:hypothetical protein